MPWTDLIPDRGEYPMDMKSAHRAPVVGTGYPTADSRERMKSICKMTELSSLAEELGYFFKGKREE